MSGASAKLLLAAFERHYEELVAHVRRRVACPALAADIVQETYIRLANSNLPPQVANPRAFVYRVAGNLAIDHMRSEKSRSRLIQSGPPTDDIPDTFPNAEAAAAGKQRIRQLLHIVDELPPKCRTVFILRKFDDMEHDEIAARLGISRNMVHKHLRHALQYCARRLSERE